MERRKIIFTVTNDLTYDQRMQRICTSLADAGYDVLLIGRKRRGSKSLQQTVYKQDRLSGFFNKGKLFYVEFNIRLFFYLLFKKCDIICAIDMDTLLPVFLAGKIKGKKVVFDAHEYFSEVPELIGRPLTKSIWRKIELLLIPQIQYAYTVSETLAKVFKEKYGTEFKVIRNLPVYKEEQLPDPDNKEKVLLYQGALNKGRGLEQMIFAMKNIDAILWLAGEGDLSEELRELVKNEGLGEKVKFLGYVLPADLKELTKNAWLGINLLDNISLSYYYSLANKTFDYIHAGVPVFNMNFPEYRNLNNKYKTGILLDKLDNDKIADAINNLFKMSDLYHVMVNNCLTAAKELNWQEEKKKLTEFYNNVH